jgi:glycosyltransferase involved in cell wall biosynthesis
MRNDEMKRYKLLIIIGSLPMGGAEHMIYELVKNIKKEKVDVEVLCYGKKLGTFLEKKMEFISRVHYMEESGTVGVYMMVRVLRYISKIRPDIIHAHLGGITFALPWAVLHKKPIVVTVHTQPEKAFSRKNEKILRFVLKSKNIRIVTVSETNKYAMQRYLSIGNEKCIFVNNGIDLDKYVSKKHDIFTYINVARQDKNKNQIAIINCFAKIHKMYPMSKLILIGDGPCHNELKKKIDELGFKNVIDLPGLVDNTEDYYAVSDCYVQASHREAMPLSVLEAMAASIPIISTDVGGLKDVVNDDNGFLVDDNDENALEKAMIKVFLMENVKRKQYGNSSRKIVEQYSAKLMAIKYENIYEEMIEN